MNMYDIFNIYFIKSDKIMQISLRMISELNADYEITQNITFFISALFFPLFILQNTRDLN